MGEEHVLPWEERDETSSKRDMMEEEVTSSHEQPRLLTSIYPNPTSNSVTIEYNWDGDEPIVLEFYDLLGSKVIKVLLPRKQGKAIFDVTHLPSGAYIYRTISNTASNQSGKIVILR